MAEIYDRRPCATVNTKWWTMDNGQLNMKDISFTIQPLTCKYISLYIYIIIILF